MESSLSHVALLVPAVETSAKFLNSRGIETEEPEVFEHEGTKEIYVGSYDTQRGLLLLLEAISEGPYKRALEKRGPSLHHIAVDVLNLEEFVLKAKNLGWKLHSVSQQTMSQKTAWLFLEGVPTLIEVDQKEQLSSKTPQVAKIELPIQQEQMRIFEGIGLGETISCGQELCLTIDGHELSFAQIAGLDEVR